MFGSNLWTMLIEELTQTIQPQSGEIKRHQVILVYLFGVGFCSLFFHSYLIGLIGFFSKNIWKQDCEML